MTTSRGGRVSGTRERLAGISQYFLSEPQPGPADTRGAIPETELLPVLVDSELAQAFVYALARALHARGITALVLHVESSLRSSDPRSSSLRSRLDSPVVLRTHLHDEISGAKLPPRICLIPVTNGQDPHLRDYRHVLVMLGASLPALKRAYLGIKRLPGGGVSSRIGAIVVGATDDTEIRHFSTHLAAAAMRFLNREVVPLGGIVAADPESELSGHAGPAARPSLDNIVDALLGNGFLGPHGNAAPGGPGAAAGNVPGRIR